MIQVENIWKSFDGVPVLRGVDLEVREGCFVALIGMSGFGKSVLLKHIAGLMRPDRGRITVAGKDLCCLSRAELRRLRAQFGFLFQGGALFDSMTIYENVAFPLREKKLAAPKEIPIRVREELARVGLEGAENKYPAQLSGGMIKRAALARCLVMQPRIMLFDEPTTGLDPIIAHAILTLIAETHRTFGFTGIIVTHRIPRDISIVDRVALLHEGRIHFYGTAEELERCSDPVVRRFVDETFAAYADIRSRGVPPMQGPTEY